MYFRVAQSNHKEGPYNSPTKTYSANPYNDNETVPITYSATSTLINVDTASLSSQVETGGYHGFIEPNMVLIGERSGAEATITDVRLVSDISGFFGGSYFIPDPNVASFPKFTAGTKQFKLTSDPDNTPSLEATSVALDNFSSQGFLETIQETIVATRNARVITDNILSLIHI